MPLYEYKCEGCGETFEVMQKFSDEPLKVHEKCGGPVHRLLSPPALQFKGSGWYVTDYAKSSSSSPAKSEKSESSGSGSDGKASGDSAGKTEAKSESKPSTSKAD